MKKTVLNPEDLKSRFNKSKRRLMLVFWILAILLASTFWLLLLPKPSNLYVIVLDTSDSMNSQMLTENGEVSSRIEVAKTSIENFADNLSENDYFMLVTFADGHCNGQGLNWITTHRSNNAGKILVDITNNREVIYELLPAIKTENFTHLSEAIFKALDHLEKSMVDQVDFKSIKMIILGDGADHCKAINAGDNAITQNWSFIDNLSVNVIGIDIDSDEAKTNFEILAADGKGQYRSVESTDEFYKELVNVSEVAAGLDILIAHIVIVIVIILAAKTALRI